MGLTSTLYRFSIALSDLDRGLYETLEFRAALHPSESLPFFVTRVLAYVLNTQEGLEFTAGISTPDEPAIRVSNLTGGLDLWVDIGNPTAKRIHKAMKAAKRVAIYTHKDARMLAEEFKREKVHRLEEIEIYSLDPKFLNAVGATLDRDNKWDLTRQEGTLYLGVGQENFQGKLEKHGLNGPA